MQKDSIEKLSEIMCSTNCFTLLNLIRNNSKLNEDFLEYILNILPQSKNDATQVMKIIIGGLELGLDTEQIKIYAKPDFNHAQMHQIFYGFLNGLNQKQICFYAKPKFDICQMALIRKCFEEGWSTKEIALFATKPEFDYYQMCFLKSVIEEKKLTIAQFKLVAKPNYSPSLMKLIYSYLEKGLNIERLKEATKIFKKFDFMGNHFDAILYGYYNGLTTEQVKFYANPKFNSYQMYKIINAFKNGLTEEQVKCFAKPDLSARQMEIICSGLEAGYLSVNQSNIYATTLFNDDQTYRVVEGYRKGLTTEQIEFYAKPIFDAEQMWQIISGFKNGLSLNDVMKYSSIKKINDMEKARTKLEKELFKKELAKLLHIN